MMRCLMEFTISKEKRCSVYTQHDKGEEFRMAICQSGRKDESNLIDYRQLKIIIESTS